MSFCMGISFCPALASFTVAVALFATTACESEKIELVSPEHAKSADFGRQALQNAILALSDSPTSEVSYAHFARTVISLKPKFNSKVARDAELRLNIHALAPLQAGFYLPADEQMERFATTVWPTILDFSANKDEDARGYVGRLCQAKLAFACRSLVPEYWPEMVNAHVWRTLNSRTLVAYGRCRWCADDEGFLEILSVLKENHLQAEIIAQRATRYGLPESWPKAAGHSEPLNATLTVSFENDGLVRVGSDQPTDGNWRQEIADKKHDAQILGLHFLPSRQVGEFLSVTKDVAKAGYAQVALIVRKREFPYEKRQYVVDSNTRSFARLGVERTDTLQVLVQALDNAIESE